MSDPSGGVPETANLGILLVHGIGSQPYSRRSNVKILLKCSRRPGPLKA